MRAERHRDPVQVFYDDLADDYDALFADWEASARRQGALLAALLPEEGPVLDVAAGMGTQAIGLALQGRSVVARDLSPRLLQRGAREAARLGAAVEFALGDMRQRRPADSGRFAAVLAMDNALPHLLDDRELRLALRACRAALRPGGRLLCSIRDYDALRAERPALDPVRLYGEAPARRVSLQLWRWAQDGGRYEMDLVVLREGPESWSCAVRRVVYRALLRAELEAAAADAGLVAPRWLEPAESGFYQPIFTAQREEGRI